jgi:hypothetical protein
MPTSNETGRRAAPEQMRPQPTDRDRARLFMAATGAPTGRRHVNSAPARRGCPVRRRLGQHSNCVLVEKELWPWPLKQQIGQLTALIATVRSSRTWHAHEVAAVPSEDRLN